MAKKSEAQHYDAFISYRHLQPDEKIAAKLQSLLENYRPPKGAGKKKKIERVFLDKAELPTSSDLGQSLRDALLHSEYLIVVLSERTRESKYCMEEIRYFKEVHGGRIDRILPILVEGEPQDAIPEALRYDVFEEASDGGPRVVRREVEPLCCDVRAESDAKREKKLKTEFLRLAAPILGCAFDSLYQRHRRRKRQIQSAVIGGSFALMAAVLAVVGVSYYRVTVANRLVTESEQRYRNSLMSSYTNTGIERALDGRPQEALAYYAKVLENTPDHENAKLGALIELQRQSWICSDGGGAELPPEEEWDVSADGANVTVTAADGSAYTFPQPSAVSPLLMNAPLPGTAPAVAPVVNDAGAFFVVNYGGVLYVYKAAAKQNGGAPILCAPTFRLDLAEMLSEEYGCLNFNSVSEMWADAALGLAAVREYEYLVLLDAVGGRIVLVLKYPPYPVKSVFFSPDGSRFAVARLGSSDFGNNGPILDVYDMSGKLLGTGEKDTKYGLVGSGYTADGGSILWARSKTVTMLDGTDAAAVSAPLWLDTRIVSAKLTEDGGIVTEDVNGAVSCYRTVRFRSVRDQAEAPEADGEEQTGRFRLSEDLKSVELLDDDGRVLDAAVGNNGSEINGSAAFFLADAEQAFAYVWGPSRDTVLRFGIREDAAGLVTEELDLQGRQTLTATLWSGGIAVGVTGGTVFLFRNGETAPYRTVEIAHEGQIGSVAVNGNGLLAVNGTQKTDEFVELWNYEENLHLANLEEKGFFIRDLRFAEDGALTYTESGREDARCWILSAPDPDADAVEALAALTSYGIGDDLTVRIRNATFGGDLGNWSALFTTED